MPPSSAPLPAIPDLDELLERGELARARRRGPGASEGRRGHPDPEKTPRPAPPQRQKPRRVIRSRIEIVTAAGWNRWPWLLHGFSTRSGGITQAYRPMLRGGDLNLGFTASDPQENVLENRRRFLDGLGAGAATELVTLRQIHSSVVRHVGTADGQRVQPWKGDGFMTDEPGVLLGIQTADCIPVLVADVKRRVVAGFHAGWRGTVRRIVEQGVGRMRLEFGSRPEDLVAAIGPGIAGCCYAIGEEVRSEFSSQFSYAEELMHEVSDAEPVREKYPLLFLSGRAPGHGELGPQTHLDLMEANRRQLLDAGLRADVIRVVGDCTRCQNNRYFSYRAEQGLTGRLLSVIGIAG